MKQIHHNVARYRFWQTFAVWFQTTTPLIPAPKNICKNIIIKIHMRQSAKQNSNQPNIGGQL